MILTPFPIRPGSNALILYSVLCFHLDSSSVLDLATFYVPSDSVLSGYVSRDFLDICSMFSFHYSLCFPYAHYVSLLHFLGLRSYP